MTTKVRIVFDALSSVPDKLSLNDILHQGPNFNSNVPDNLRPFRTLRMVVTTDIGKAFYKYFSRKKIAMPSGFYGTRNHTPLAITVEIWRMNRVPCDATSSPSLLAPTPCFYFEASKKRFPEVASRIKREFFVDEYVTGEKILQDALNLCNEAATIVSETGMPLRKWATNSSGLREFATKERGSHSDVKFRHPTIRKVLGVMWNPETGTLHVDTPSVRQFVTSTKVTKGSVIQATARIYDHFGFLPPFFMNAKILFQRMGLRELKWDELLPEDLRLEWCSWSSRLPSLNGLVSSGLILILTTPGRTSSMFFRMQALLRMVLLST